MENITEKGPEGGAQDGIVFEFVVEGDNVQVLGDFSLGDLLGEVTTDDDVADDVPDAIAVRNESPDDANASNSEPSDVEDNKWRNELKESEFILHTREEMRDFVESTRNPNTVRKTNQVVAAFQRWLRTYCDEARPIETIEPGEMDAFLSNYLLTKKKSKGGQHQPDTLTSIHRAVLRHLKHNNYPVDPMFDDAFEMSREILASKRTKLKQEGLGNRPNRAESFDDEEIDKMWEKGALGASDPTTLQHTVYWYLAIGFGLRGCDKSRNMKWGDVVVEEDKDGIEHLIWTERSSKTRQGGEGGHVRAFAPKIYATSDEFCPLKFYKLFASKRPQAAMTPDAPFYLTVRQNATLNDHYAYTTGPMGINKLREIVKIICSKAGIPGRHTNHSLRKTTCQTLMANNVPPVMVAQLSGHKCLASLNNYATATKPQQRAMSEILTGKRSSDPTSQFSLPAKRKSSTDNDPTSHGNMVLPPAPVAQSLPRPHPYYMPVSTGQNNPENSFQRMSENMAGMLQGAYVNGPITMHFNYNLQANTHSQVNMSPKLPSVE